MQSNFSAEDVDASCGSDFVYDNTTATISWVDTLATDTTIESVTIELNWGVNCLAQDSETATSEFNSQQIPALTSLGTCACPSSGPYPNTNALPAAYYLAGHTNVLDYTPSVSVGFIAGAGSLVGTVTVTYAP